MRTLVECILATYWSNGSLHIRTFRPLALYTHCFIRDVTEVFVWGKMHSVAKNEKKSSGVSDVSVHEDQLLPRMLELPEERKVREQATFGVG